MDWIIAYRVDTRIVEVGEPILPRKSSFIRNNDPDANLKLRVEEILEKARPNNKPKRDSILMLFTNLERAKRYWSISSDANLYMVEVKMEDILHIGDYQIVEKIFPLVRSAETEDEFLLKVAEEYWNEVEIEEEEIFVNSAINKEIIGDNTARLTYLNKRLGITPMERDED